LHAILIDPAKPDVIWWQSPARRPQHAGVFRTVDEGRFDITLEDERDRQIGPARIGGGA
jgi:hypothetical protein